MRRRTVVIAAVSVVAVVATACSHSGSKNSGARSALDATGYASANQAVVGAPSTAPNAGNGGGGDAAGGGAAKVAADKVDLTDPQALIKTANMTVTVKKDSDVAAQANQATTIAVGAGGAVFADQRTTGTDPTASLTLKVPNDSLTHVLDELSALGVEQSRQVSTQDVTSDVADVNSRVKSATDAITSLQGLYDRATKLSDIITIENELAQREADLESLQAQQRALTAQTSMATIALLLTTKAGTPVVHHKRTGFLGGLDSGWRHFTASATWLGTAAGAVLPFALLLLVVGAAGVYALRRRPHPAPAPVPPTDLV